MSQPANPAAAPAPSPVRFSVLLDSYYSLNLNHPASRANQLRNFDVAAKELSLGLARLSANRAPAPIGFHFDIGFGKTFDIIHSAEADPGAFRYVQQAYVSFAPKQADGLRLDFGKFVTAAGAEVIESHLNWNYSRSLLFSYAIPFYHFGLRMSAPVGEHLSAGIELVNGWNNVLDNNSGKTVGLSASFSRGGIGWTHVYYFGPEKPDTNKGWRQVYDTTLRFPAGPRTDVYLNFDYGREAGIAGEENQHWVGVAGAARIRLHPRVAVTPRLEWFRDADGFATGAAQRLKEATLTAEWRLAEGVWTRLEWRRDWSDIPFFDRGPDLAVSRSQQTFLAGLMFCFACEP